MMDEASVYQAVDEAAARVTSRAVISKLRLKQLVYSVVVITFVSVGAITFSNVSTSTPVTTGDPSDNPIQSVVFFPLTRPPTPSPSLPSVAPAKTLPAPGVTTTSPPQPTRTRPTPRPRTKAPTVSPQPTDSSPPTFASGADAAGNDDNDAPMSVSSGSKATSPSTDAPSSSGSDQPATTPPQDGIGTPSPPSGAATPPASAPSSAGNDQPATTTPPGGTTTGSSNGAVTVMPSLDGSTSVTPTSSSPASSSTTTTSTPLPTAGDSPTPSDLDVAPGMTLSPSVSAASPSLPPSAPAAIAVTQPPSPSPSTLTATPAASAGNEPGSPLFQPLPTPQRTRTTTSSPTASSASLKRVAPPAVVLDDATVALVDTTTRPIDLPPAAIQDNSPLSVDLIGVSNLSEYPFMDCILPNYVSKDGKLYAVGPDGESYDLVIKGVSWFGMDSDARIPYGLRTTDRSGSTLFEIAAFLARNNFNSVRLALSVDSVLTNAPPNAAFINTDANRALDVTTYRSTLESVIKALAFHRISVLLSLDVGAVDDIDAATTVDEAAQLDAIDVLTANLCSTTYWNVLGLDLQNEPLVSSTWGDDGPNDFRAAATRLGDRMLDGCPKWLAFVQGISSESYAWTAPSSGETYRIDASYGGGLASAATSPVTLAKADKVVYAPHFHSPAAYPSRFFFQADDVSELSDAALTENVRGAFDVMFGYLATAAAETSDSARSSPTLVLGSFGGLYTTDQYAQKTTQRAFLITLQRIAEANGSGIAGGYVWSLGPETGFDFNVVRASDPRSSPFREGLVQADWRTANAPLLAALQPLDALTGLAKLQCFKKPFRL